MDIPLTIDEYVEKIGRECFPELDDIALPCDAKLARLSVRLAASFPSRPIARTVMLSRMINRLHKSGYLCGLSLKLTWSKKEIAYMRDSGLVCFSVPYVAVEKGPALVKVVMHELAHLILSRQGEYTLLDTLNREYLSRFSSLGEEGLILSPTELYATLLSVRLMHNAVDIADASGRVREMLDIQIDREMKKLTYAIDKYKNIYFYKENANG